MTFFFTGLTRGRFLIGVMQILVAMTCLFVNEAAHAGAKEINFNGHYELAGVKTGRTFTLDVKQTKSRAEITFSAAMDDGTGAAPDGTGKGEVEDGVLSFKFEDSFKNEGTATLESMKDGFHLSMIIIKVVDPDPFHFYGTIRLKKTSEKPQ
jgi:hypothetical protein